MELTAADRDTQKDLKLRDVLVVRLPENPTTGYRWIPVVDETKLQLLSNGFAVSSAATGAPGLHSFEFRAIQEGDVELYLVMRRTWEKAPSDEYRVELHVRS